ncbi:beta-galactosidase BglB [Paenibacillus sp. strain BS8-2]
MDRGTMQRTLTAVSDKMMRLDNETNMDETCPISIIDMNQWEWAQGVGLYGLLKQYEASGDRQLLDELICWFDARIGEGLPERNVNTTCPMLTLSYMYAYTGREDYLRLCEDWAEWIVRDMPRTEQNGLQHIVSGEPNEQQLWDDTLFMTVLFLARMGKLLDRQDYVDESVRQFLVHLAYLTDRKSGLLFHGWTFAGRHHFAEALWARGNCWLTVAIPDYLEMIDGSHGGVKHFLLDSLQAQVNALRSLQSDSGMWPTLLNEPQSYGETSATAGFAYGILKCVRLGYLGNEYLENGLRAAEAVARRIAADGTVLEVSYGTGMGADLDAYRNIPICPMTYGQALAILMLTEWQKIDEAG